ncbi:transposase [Pseudoalteromonas sp. A25]|uniref:transposase n=1 Tax=Pseudoalteromonas sp. A25 TaxID=116092 RepID=UPI0015628FE9
MTLDEAQRRFWCIIHTYCLMSNHYHLLIETHSANLGRIMRHVNGSTPSVTTD